MYRMYRKFRVNEGTAGENDESEEVMIKVDARTGVYLGAGGKGGLPIFLTTS